MNTLHGPLEAGEYWACEQPESPPRNGIWWDENCDACRIAFEAAAVVTPNFLVHAPGGPVPISVDPIAEWAFRYTPYELSIEGVRAYRSAQ